MNKVPREEWTTKTIREIAERIAKKAAGSDYIEDGGYIRDWLAHDIEKAINDVRIATLKECFELIRRYHERDLHDLMMSKQIKSLK